MFIEHRADLGVAAGDLLAAHEQLAGLARAEHVAVLVTDLQLDAGHRLSDRAQPLGGHGVLCGVRRAVVVGAQHRDRRAGLGQTVGVDETHIRQQFQRPADQWQTHLGAAISEVAQRR